MPKHPIYVGLFFITALSTGALAAVSDTIAKIDQFISAEMSRQAIPGMALAAVKNGEIVVAKGYGFANLDPRVPATRHSIFQAGSIGKQFTAAAILLLKEHGKLRLDDRVARYLPFTQASWGSITLRHLLTHTSGIPDYEDEIDDQRDYSERQLTEFVGLLSRKISPRRKIRIQQQRLPPAGRDHPSGDGKVPCGLHSRANL